MHFAEVGAVPACALKGMGNGFLLQTQWHPLVVYTCAVRSPAGKERGSCRRAHRRTGVVALEPQPIRCHRCQVGRPEALLGIAPFNFAPALIVREELNDVRDLRSVPHRFHTLRRRHNGVSEEARAAQ